MSELFVSADVRGLDRLMADLTALGGTDAGALLRKRAGLLGRVCAERTQPVTDRDTGGQVTESTVKASGTSPAARRMGEKAIIKDLRRCFDVTKGATVLGPSRGQPERTAIRAKNGHVYLVDTAIVAASASQMHPHHQSRRLPSNGRTSMAGFRNQKRGRWKSRELLIVPQGWWQSYSRSVFSRVGFAKSAWLTAARQIPGAEGLAKLPRWITRHAAPGRGIDRTRGADPHVVLISGVSYAQKVLTDRQLAGVGNAFGVLIAKDIRAQIRHLKKRHSA